MQKCALLAVGLCGLLAANRPAAASATYQWQSANPSDCCAAVLEISDEAYAAGSFSTHLEHPGDPQALPGNPVIRFELTAFGDRVVFDRTQARGFFDFDISLIGNTLSGQIHANDVSTDTLLSGTKDSWSVKDHHADHPGACFRATNLCGGTSGHWVLVVPPPGA